MSRPLLLLLGFSLFACAPLLAPGYFMLAHDAHHSLTFLVEFDQGIRSGFLWPRWSPDYAMGYGYPLFTFYSPLAFYAAEIPHLLGLGVVAAIKLVWGLAFIASGLSMYAFARRLWGPWPGFVAGLVYLYAPYHLADIYVRAALAEFVAFAIFPLALHALWALVDADAAGKPWARRIALAAISLSLAPLTHSVTGMVFVPLAALLALLWLLLRWRRQARLPAQSTLATAAAGVLGMGLAAIFLIPLIFEGDYIVQEHWLPTTYNYLVQFLYPHQLFSLDWGFGHALVGPDDGMSFQLGLWPILLSLGGAAALIWGRIPHRGLLLTLTLAAAGSIFGTLALSRPLWDAIPLMALLQFPWRLLAFANLFMALLAAGAAAWFLAARNQAPPAAPPLLLALGLAILLASYPYTRPQHTPVTPAQISPAAIPRYELTYPLNVASTAFSQAGPPADSPKLAAYLAGEPLPLAGIIAGRGEVKTLAHGGGAERVFVRAETPVTLQFYTYWYPGWQATVNGVPHPLTAAGPDALITLDLPAGEHEVAIRFRNTPLRTAAALISALSALIVLALLLRR